MPLTVIAWKAIVTTFQVLAVACATFRLYRRFKQRNTWWDDYWALLALVLDFVYFGSVYIKKNSDANVEGIRARVALFWITGTISPLIVWCARISICLTIARIDVRYTSLRARLWVYIVTIAFGLVGVALLAPRVWVCTRTTAWHRSPTGYCTVGKPLGIISLSGDLTADAVLTFISLRLLWKVRISRSRRRLLSWAFGANVLSSLAGIYYAAMIFLANGGKPSPGRNLLVGLSGHVKVSVTLIVCNLLTIITYLYSRFWNTSEDSDSESDDAPTSGRHVDLPSGRTTKPATRTRDTALVLTEFDSDSCVTSRRPESTRPSFMTWASTRLGLGPKTPPALGSNEEHSMDSSPRRAKSRSAIGSEVPSEPSSVDRTDPLRSHGSHPTATLTSNDP